MLNNIYKSRLFLNTSDPVFHTRVPRFQANLKQGGLIRFCNYILSRVFGRDYLAELRKTMKYNEEILGRPPTVYMSEMINCIRVLMKIDKA